MSNEETLNSVIDIPEIRAQFDVLLGLLDKTADKIIQLNGKGVELKAAKGFRDTAEAANKLTKEQQELEKIQKQLSAATGEYAAQIAQAKVQLEAQRKENKQVAREATGLAGEYEKLSKRLIELRKEYKDLAAAGKENTAAAQALKKETIDLDARLKAIDASVGQFGRNVGNYTGAFGQAFDVLKSELNNTRSQMKALEDQGRKTDAAYQSLAKQEQLLAELTTGLNANFTSTKQELRALQEAAAKLGLELGQNNQVFQSFKNQVGEAKDSIDDIRDSVKLAASDTRNLDQLIETAQALAGGFAIAQGAAALFGGENEELEKTFVKLQAVMTILNGLQAIQSALRNKDSIFTKVQIVLENALTRAKIAGAAATRLLSSALIATGLGALLLLLPLAVQAFERFTGAVKDANKEARDYGQTIEYLNSTFDRFIADDERRSKEAVASAKARGASEQEVNKIEQDGLRARRENLVAKAKLLDEELANQGLGLEDYKKLAAEQRKVNSQIADVDTELFVKRKELSEKGREQAEKDRKAYFEINKAKYENIIDANNRILESESSTSAQRIDALNKAFSAQRSIIEAERDLELKTTGLTAAQRKAIFEKANTQILILGRDFQSQLSALFRETADKDQQTRMDAYEKSLAQLEYFQSDEEALLSAAYKRGEISKEAYEAEKYKIAQKYQLLALQSQLSFTERELASANLTQERKAELERQLLSIKKQLLDQEVSANENATDKILARREELNGKLQELQAEITNVFFELGQASFDRQKNQVQEEIDDIDKKKAAEIERINSSQDSEEKKAAQIAIINARVQSQKEELERRQRQIDQERVRFERTRDIAAITANTARGVTAALTSTPPNVPLSIVIGAIGLAQLANVVARPIPKYAGGVDDHPGGPAWVGDGFRHEVFMTPDGGVGLTPAVPTLVDLPKHSKVIPSVSDYMALTAAAGMPFIPISDSAPALTAEAFLEGLGRHANELKEAMARNRPIITTNYTWRGVQQSFRTAAGEVEFINRYVNWS